MQQPVAASQEEGVPPAAATAARSAQSQAVAEERAAADDDDEAPPAAALLPLGGDEFPDEALAVVCSFLGLRELGRLACAARRVTEPTLTEPGGGGAGSPQLLSPIEEGARLRLAAGGGSGGGSGGGAAAVRLADETWVWALWRVQYRLQFTSCGPSVVLSEEGALRACGAVLGGSARLGTHAGFHSLMVGCLHCCVSIMNSAMQRWGFARHSSRPATHERKSSSSSTTALRLTH
jgi:hypothetical protein